MPKNNTAATVNKTVAIAELGLDEKNSEFFDIWLSENGYDFEAAAVPATAIEKFKTHFEEFLSKTGLPPLEAAKSPEPGEPSASGALAGRTVTDLKQAFQSSTSISEASFEVLALLYIEQAMVKAQRLAQVENLAFDSAYAKANGENLTARMSQKVDEIERISGMNLFDLVNSSLGGANAQAEVEKVNEHFNTSLERIRALRREGQIGPNDWMQPVTISTES